MDIHYTREETERVGEAGRRLGRGRKGGGGGGREKVVRGGGKEGVRGRNREEKKVLVQYDIIVEGMKYD